MGKATQRREKREAKRLKALAKNNPEQFCKEWHRKVDAWIFEIMARAAAEENENIAPAECLSIFGVMAKAERLLKLCGEQAEQLVGVETNRVIENECCKAIARLAGPHLYRLNNSASNYQFMVSGAHRPPRR